MAFVLGAPAFAAGPAAARDVALRLGRAPNFLIGMGNDLSPDYDHSKDGAYTLGVTLDLHYAYLVGLPGQGGWPDWNANGSFVNILTDSAAAKGVVPMFTLYQMAAWGEANLAVLTNAGYMGPYWSGARLLFQRLAVFNKPAVVHLEPDFWGFAQTQNGNPAAIAVRVRAHAPECADLPDDLTGMGRCLVRMARQISPKVVVGFHASGWSGSPAATSAYLNAIGANQADIVVVETLDRDAGCFEAHVDPNCQRGGTFYWDETNRTSPNFSEHLAWARGIYDGVGRPILWWQMPFGVPSSTPGGTAGHYRDNRVRYLFSHVAEFVAAGGLGAAFGTGAGNQTYITSDGGQFRNAVHAYYASPTPLPAPNLPPPTGNFFTLTPCRLLDTRTANAPLAAAESRVVTAVGRCGIPATARALALNVTAVLPNTPGNLSVYPADVPAPKTSVVNFSPWVTRANSALLGLSSGGALTIRSGQQTGGTHVVLDASGYFE
jgi:hypothetical protein